MSAAKKVESMSMQNNLNLSQPDPHYKEVVREVSSIVSELSGITLGEKQYSMVENRLRTRMIKLNINSPDEYLSYLKRHKETESQSLLSLITTHHTYFFREFAHFEFLQTKGLKRIIEGVRARGDKTLRIWSAACSRGQEVYSLSMFFKFYLPKFAPELSFEIVGSDVDPESVKIASNGVYSYNEIKEIPQTFLGDHWARGKGEIADFVKAKNSIKDHCQFEVVNLHNPPASFKNKKFDIIFCRNVFIYFTPEQIRDCASMFLDKMYPEGYLFVGISESLTGLNVPVNYAGPSVYENKNTSKTQQIEVNKVVPKIKVEPIQKSVQPGSVVKPSEVAKPQAVEELAAPLKVLCVDDSSSILVLLKKILSKENGFDVVATASNGIEAAEALKKYKIDLITLDIHMPEMDGLSYLKKYYNSQHPPVVMISSVNRENADMALHALELGASDYIEKPTLSNLSERGDEIRSKLKTAHLNKQFVGTTLTNVDKSFKKKFIIDKPEAKLRVVTTGLSSKKHLGEIVKLQTSNDPALFVCIDGAESALESMTKSFEQNYNKKMNIFTKDSSMIKPGEIYVCDTKHGFEYIKKCNKKTSIMVLGVPTDYVIKNISEIKNMQIVLEDLGANVKRQNDKLYALATNIVPATSYMSISEEWF